MKKENKSFLKECLIILFVGIIVNAACFLMGSLHARAETVTTQLPYITSNNPYFNESEVANALDAISQAYPDDNLQNIIVFLSSEYVWWDYNTYIPSKSYIVYNLSGFTYSSSWGTVGSNLSPNASNFDLYGNDYIDVNFDNFTSYTCTYRGDIGTNYNGLYVSKTTASSATRRFFSSYQPIHIENSKVNFDYLQNYPVYTNVSWFTNDNRGDAITYLTMGVNDPVIGDFSELPPLDELLNNILNNNTPGTPGTPSSVDQNKTDLQNFADFFNNLQNSISSNINSLGANIKSWFDNLQKKLTDVANSISKNIYNGFATLMQNIKDFFGPKLDAIIEKLEYITKPFDSSEFVNDLNNSTFATSALGLIVSVQSFSENFLSGSEPNSCTFTLDFTNAFYNFGVCTFSLDWLLPIRPIIRLFLGGLCLYSLIVSIFTSLNTYIGGTSSINDDI